MFNNKFLKHDPLLEAVKTAQEEGAMRRQAEAQVNEEFGVYSRNAVIRENLAAYDARLAELVEAKLADKDYDKDGKIESGKAEYQGSRIRAAKEAGKLEELKDSTLKSYVDKSKKELKDTKDQTGVLDKDRRGTRNRLQGIGMASVKMAKEETQIDEISRTTLKSYVKKADRQANNLERKVDRRKDRPGEEEKMYKRIEGANLARRKMGVRVAATEETDYSAQDRAPVTKSAPKEDPSLPKSYPGAASSAPTAQRLSNAKAAVTPIKEGVTAPKEFKQGRFANKGAVTKAPVPGVSIAEEDQLDELKAPTAKTAHAAYDRAEQSDDVEGNWNRSNRLYSYLKKKYPGKSGRNQKSTGKAKLPSVSNTEFHKDGYSGHVTKKGKLTKSATKDTKADIKSRLGRHTKPNLPEEAINEISNKVKQSYIEKAGKEVESKKSAGFKKDYTEKKGKKADAAREAVRKRIKGMTSAFNTMKENTNLQELSAFGRAFAAAKGHNFSFGGKQYSGARADQKTSSAPLPPTKPAELKSPTTWKDPVSAGYDKPAASTAPEPKAAPLPTMAQSNVGPKAGAGAGVASLPGASQSASITNPKPAMDPGSIENAKRKTGSLNESVQVGANKYRIV